MANDNKEYLADVSKVMLYGRPFDGLQLGKAAGTGEEAQRVKTAIGKKGQLARIYGFAFEGSYHTLAPPCVIVVQGEGVAAANHAAGLVKEEKDFVDGVLVWLCDKDDLSLRIDISTGLISDILLEHALQAQSLQTGFSTKMQMSHRSGRLTE